MYYYHVLFIWNVCYELPMESPCADRLITLNVLIIAVRQVRIDAVAVLICMLWDVLTAYAAVAHLLGMLSITVSRLLVL